MKKFSKGFYLRIFADFAEDGYVYESHAIDLTKYAAVMKGGINSDILDELREIGVTDFSNKDLRAALLSFTYKDIVYYSPLYASSYIWYPTGYNDIEVKFCLEYLNKPR